MDRRIRHHRRRTAIRRGREHHHQDRTGRDVDLSVINSNFAMEAQLNPVKDSLFTEPKDSPYANILAIRKGDDKRPELQKLDKALTSPEVKKFIEEKYKGAVVPAF